MKGFFSIVGCPGTVEKCLKMLKLIKVRSFGLKKPVGGMVGRCMPNSGPGGPPGTRVMTIFGIYVNPQIPNTEYFEVYGGLQIPGGISSFFSSNFLSNPVRIMSGTYF